MSPSKKRIVQSVLSPICKRKSKSSSSSENIQEKTSSLIQCPSCRKRIYSHVINQHLDICKPSKTMMISQQSTNTNHAVNITNTLPTIYFCIDYTSSFEYVISINECKCNCMDDSQRPYFSHLIQLRDYVHMYGIESFLDNNSNLCLSIQSQLCTKNPTQSTSLLTGNDSNINNIPIQLQIHASRLISTSRILIRFDLVNGSIGTRLPLSVLKSALQKNIRRGKASAAVRVAIVLIRRQANGITDLLRRLSIIIIEDALLHPLYDYIIWLMIACGRDYRPTHKDIYTLLQIVHEIGIVKILDTLELNENENEKDKTKSIGKNYVICLRIRSSYGGMKCDKDLLKLASERWKKRFESIKGNHWKNYIEQVYEKCKKESVQMMNEEEIDKLFEKDNIVLRTGDIGLEAWDFHCCSVSEQVSLILNKDENVSKKLEMFANMKQMNTKEYIESLIWKYRSSITIKKSFSIINQNNLIDLKEKEFWKENIENIVNEWCRNFRKRYGL